MLNHIVIMGRLTKDPELNHTKNGKTVLTFCVAVDRDRSPQGQERQTDFINCVAWNAKAEFISKYFQKGSLIVVSGRLQMREWTDNDNNKRVSAEILASDVYFGGSKRDGGSEPAVTEPGGSAFAELDDDYDEGNVPF